MSWGLVAGELLLVAGDECEAQHQDKTVTSQVQSLTGGVTGGGAASRWDTAPWPWPPPGAGAR